jgi:hypothetical protein
MTEEAKNPEQTSVSEIEKIDIGDPKKLRSIKVRVEDNSKEVDRLVDMIVAKYNRDLDEFMLKTKELVETRDARHRDLSDLEIENMVLKVPLFLYFAASGLETLGIEGDSAKAIKMETFNDKYLRAAGTIKDKEKVAELLTMNEYIVEIAYVRASKKLKIQIEMCVHLFSGVKKILTKRMLDIEIASGDKGTFRSERDEDTRGRRK